MTNKALASAWFALATLVVISALATLPTTGWYIMPGIMCLGIVIFLVGVQRTNRALPKQRYRQIIIGLAFATAIFCSVGTVIFG